MRILQVCLRVPYPPSDGGAIAMFNLAEALTSAGNEVKMFCVNTSKHFVDLNTLPQDFATKYKPEAVYVDTRVKAFDAFKNLFQNSSYNISRFYSEEFSSQLTGILEKVHFDVIVLESLFMAPYVASIRSVSKAKLILRAHNVEHVIWERLAASSINPLKKWYVNLLSSRLREYEISVLNGFDGLLPITSLDEAAFQKLGCKIPVLTVPVSLNAGAYENQITSISDPSFKRVFHLGSMDWMPNREAVDWFLKKVFPDLKEMPGIELHLAGKEMPKEMFDLKNSSLHVYGRVDDARGFMRNKQIMIVPLLSGGGMRVKIVEGMALGKTIITTTIGAEGISYTNGENILIADTPEDFASVIKKCLADPAFTAVIGANARKLALECYDNKAVGRTLTDFLTKIRN